MKRIAKSKLMLQQLLTYPSSIGILLIAFVILKDVSSNACGCDYIIIIYLVSISLYCCSLRLSGRLSGELFERFGVVEMGTTDIGQVDSSSRCIIIDLKKSF
jgi:hypothetical protein